MSRIYAYLLPLICMFLTYEVIFTTALEDLNDVDHDSHCLTDVVFYRGQKINVTLEEAPTVVVVKTTKKK